MSGSGYSALLAGLALLGRTVAGAGTSYWLLVVPLVAAGV